MQTRWKGPLRPGASRPGTRREPRTPAPVETAPAGCGWFESSDELRRGLDVLEADEGAAPPAFGLLRPPLVR